jgi:hypothetical protein
LERAIEEVKKGMEKNPPGGIPDRPAYPKRGR